MSISIANSFSIGYRCNTDDFMKGLNIRKYSSPFSYMVCDLETSIHFIMNNFKDFLNVTSKNKNKHKFKWNGKLWNHNFFFRPVLILN